MCFVLIKVDKQIGRNWEEMHIKNKKQNQRNFQMFWVHFELSTIWITTNQLGEIILIMTSILPCSLPSPRTPYHTVKQLHKQIL